MSLTEDFIYNKVIHKCVPELFNVRCTICLLATCGGVLTTQTISHRSIFKLNFLRQIGRLWTTYTRILLLEEV